MESISWRMCLEALKESEIIYKSITWRELCFGEMENQDAR